jgi:hypothetical protein
MRSAKLIFLLSATALVAHEMVVAVAQSDISWPGRGLALAPQPAGHPMLPDPKLTPGATDPAVTQSTIKQTICKSGYTSTVRNVTEAEKRAVMVRYGLPLSELSKVEIDHFVSLEIGGSNDVTNLWPEYYDPAPGQSGYLGARQKDVVETELHREVCGGKINLSMAQLLIRTWPDYYRKLKSKGGR